jgi:hypothetical protein
MPDELKQEVKYKEEFARLVQLHKYERPRTSQIGHRGIRLSMETTGSLAKYNVVTPSSIGQDPRKRLRSVVVVKDQLFSNRGRPS